MIIAKDSLKSQLWIDDFPWFSQLWNFIFFCGLRSLPRFNHLLEVTVKPEVTGFPAGLSTVKTWPRFCQGSDFSQKDSHRNWGNWLDILLIYVDISWCILIVKCIGKVAGNSENIWWTPRKVNRLYQEECKYDQTCVLLQPGKKRVFPILLWKPLMIGHHRGRRKSDPFLVLTNWTMDYPLAIWRGSIQSCSTENVVLVQNTGWWYTYPSEK